MSMNFCDRKSYFLSNPGVYSVYVFFYKDMLFFGWKIWVLLHFSTTSRVHKKVLLDKKVFSVELFIVQMYNDLFLSIEGIYYKNS